MAEATGIEWADSTFNPWIGCTKVGPGCDNCYAENRMDKRLHVVNWGAGQPRKRTSVKNWALPLLWDRQEFIACEACGWRGVNDIDNDGDCQKCGSGKTSQVRRRVFCSSLADVFDNEVPIEWLVDLLDLIRRTPNLDWLLLTKRIGNWRGRVGAALNASNSIELREWLALWLAGDAPTNVWLGSTIVNQAEADRDIQKLLAAPARIRFLSMEPLLGPVSFHHAMQTVGCGGCHQNAVNPRFGKRDKCNVCHRSESEVLAEHGMSRGLVDWVIVGGESGPNSRLMHIEWARSLRDQCTAAGVPFLFKQWGEHNDCGEPVGKKKAGRLLDGKYNNGYPAVSA